MPSQLWSMVILCRVAFGFGHICQSTYFGRWAEDIIT